MCMIESADDAYASFPPVVRETRKDRKCGECRRTIARGEHYERVVMVFERGDKPTTFVTCVHCVAARSWLTVVCSGWLFEGMREDLEQHWLDEPEYRSVHLGRLVIGLRNRWARRDGAGLLPVPPETTRDMVPVAA